MTQQKSEVRFSRLREYHEYKMRKSEQPSKPPTTMKQSKYKEGDLVEIVINKIRPSSVGKVGTITKVKPVLRNNEREYLYKVCLLGRSIPLPAWATDEFIKPYKQL